MWGRLDDKFWRNPKVLAAGDDIALWLLALSYCLDYETDGLVPDDWIMDYWVGHEPRRVVAAWNLVMVGLWEKGEPSGFRFHDWDRYAKQGGGPVDTARRAAEKAGDAARRAADRAEVLREVTARRNGTHESEDADV